MNLKDRNGCSPLSYAAINGHFQVTKLLLEREDVDVTSKDNKGQLPLAYAAGHSEVAQLLVMQTTVGQSSPNDIVASPATMSSSYPQSDGMQYFFDTWRTFVM